MKKDFSLSNDKAMINFTVKYCATPEQLLDSNGFKRVLNAYLDKIKKKHTTKHVFISENLVLNSDSTIADELVCLFKLLDTLSVEEIKNLNNRYTNILTKKESFNDFVEDLYNYWRKLERYTIVQNNRINEGLEKVSFIDANSNFTKLILNLYRKIQEKVMGLTPSVYRQLPAGGNAGIILNKAKWNLPEGYEKLKDIPFFDSIMLSLPFTTYPKKNTRSGMFKETYENPLKSCTIDDDHWFCYPAKIGHSLAYLYFHRDLMAHGITLCNLFEMAKEEEYNGKKPDIVYVFGARDESDVVKTVFYDDIKNDIMLGYVNYSDEIDYFGYMKKMSLTLHNLIMIKKNNLPLHGAMVNIVMNNGKSANVVIVGDSGAGKSESLEAFRYLSEDFISDMTIIFDDMGTAKIEENGSIKCYGTEIGAFVRLDDLAPGYAFKEIDRSIFMNPDKINARLVMPISSYKDIIKGYPVDLFLYANNYEEVTDEKEEIEFFNNPADAIDVFKAGIRMAKGTTSETGLVESYFANPFGPAQKQVEVDKLLEKYFAQLFSTGVRVGQIRTSLGIVGKEKDGPIKAAKKLFDIIVEMK